MSENEDDKVTCYRCQYVADKSDQYCIRCGAPLHNYCTDDGGTVSKGCKKKNIPEAAFCAKCGQPTTFQKEGLVAPYPL